MGFWIFMLVNELLLPFLMIGFGRSFQKHPPKKINPVYGYRTKMSSLNMETWNYAHTCCGSIWQRSGCAMFPVVLLCMVFTLGKSDRVIGTVGTVILLVQVGVMLLSVAATERKLHKTFDFNGHRKE